MNQHRTLSHLRQINRRDFLKVGGLAGAASVLAACGNVVCPATPAPSPAAPSPTAAPTAQPSTGEVAVRIAHMTDMHISPGDRAVEDLRWALHDAQSRTPKIDFILNSGDTTGDSLGAQRDQVQASWDAFHAVLDAENSLPIHHAIGNHDVWGWGLPLAEQKHLATDPLFGKGFALQQLGLSERYYSFDESGWRFLVLDSTHLPPTEFPEYPHPYIGELDDDQYNWLVQQLESTPATMPVCIASHIPILSGCELIDGPTEQRGNWVVPGAWVHIDARRLWSRFWEHRNVTLCLSGHTHQVEDLRYHGVKYLSNGSTTVAYMDFTPGYAIVNLYKDGSSTTEFVTH